MDQPLGARGRERARDRARRATPCAARGRPTSPSSCSTRARGCSRSPISAIDVDEGRRRAEAAVADGSALARLRALDPRAGRRPGPGRAAAAPGRPRGRGAARRARRRGSARSHVGSAALHLGAGRRTKEDEIDHAVGVVCRAKRGDRVAEGDVARRDPRAERSRRRARRRARCWPRTTLGDEPPRRAVDPARRRST